MTELLESETEEWREDGSVVVLLSAIKFDGTPQGLPVTNIYCARHRNDDNTPTQASNDCLMRQLLEDGSLPLVFPLLCGSLLTPDEESLRFRRVECSR